MRIKRNIRRYVVYIKLPAALALRPPAAENISCPLRRSRSLKLAAERRQLTWRAFRSAVAVEINRIFVCLPNSIKNDLSAGYGRRPYKAGSVSILGRRRFPVLRPA